MASSYRDALGIVIGVANATGNPELARLADAAGAFLGIGGAAPRLVGDVLLQLGEYQFSVGTAAHQSIARKHEWRWAQVDRLSRTPAQQYVGPGVESISLQGLLYPEFAGDDDQIAAMRAQADLGEPLLLVDHFGNVFGLYCIRSIAATGTALDPKGLPRRIEFSIELVAYGEDDIGGGEAAAAP